MANNYTTLACLISLPPEAARFAVALDGLLCALDQDNDHRPETIVVDVHDPSCTAGQRPEAVEVTDAMMDSARAIFADHEYFGTAADFLVRDDGLYIASLGGVDLEILTELIHAAMAHYVVPGGVGIEWANTCDKLRPGEFGGGAAVITKDQIHWMSTSQWINATLNRSALKIAVEVHGGLASVTECPDGVDVEIRDYDIDGIDLTASELDIDKNGRQYYRS